MLNKAIKEIMSENGAQASVLCVAMGKSESTFSRMFMSNDSNPKSDDIALLARRLNVNVSDIYLKLESMRPELCRFFYSDAQRQIKRDCMAEEVGEEISESFVYINGDWKRFTEKTDINGSSNFKDAVYLGEAPRWNTKRDGNVHCPDLYKQLCDELKAEKAK